MSYLFVALGVLLLVALVARAAARRAGQASGLPAGRLVYSDTGHAVGRVAPAEKNAEGVRQERPLVSRRYGLTGRPDYLVHSREGIIPVEAKSTRLPADGRPYDSHVMQLAAYCLLAEDALGARVPHGVIRYSDGEVTVDYTRELRDELLMLLGEMREAREAGDVHRSHTDARRCKGCSVREHCEERLA